MKLMRDWLEQARRRPQRPLAPPPARCPGWSTRASSTKLKDAEGREFDQLFLRYMTQHHRGALTMVQQLEDEGGGGESEIGQFILHVDADQAIEIQRMQQLG